MRETITAFLVTFCFIGLLHGQSKDMVITGYQTERKVDITGAISVVDVDAITDATTVNPLLSLQGRVPGLYIEQSGRSSGEIGQLLIRGINTLNNNAPLFIIDGVPTTDPFVFASLNVHSIASIQVLKDAASTSIYGVRAANGVIIVSTK